MTQEEIVNTIKGYDNLRHKVWHMINKAHPEWNGEFNVAPYLYTQADIDALGVRTIFHNNRGDLYVVAQWEDATAIMPKEEIESTIKGHNNLRDMVWRLLNKRHPEWHEQFNVEPFLYSPNDTLGVRVIFATSGNGEMPVIDPGSLVDGTDAYLEIPWEEVTA